jgi:hypothetical protein
MINSSANSASVGGTGLAAGTHHVLSMRFCCFFGDTGGNCLKLQAIASGTIACIVIVGCAAKSTPDVNTGLIHVRDNPVTIRTSVFQSNTYDAFLGGDGTTVTFIGCVFDGTPRNTTGASILISSASCVETAGLTVIPECDVWTLPGAAATATSGQMALATSGQMALATKSPQSSATATLPRQTGTFTMGFQGLMSPRMFWQTTAFLICMLDDG